MDTRDVLLLVVAIVVAMIGWMLNTLYQSLKGLEKEHHSHVATVAKDYVTKDDFKDQLDHIRNTCDNIWKAIRKGD